MITEPAADERVSDERVLLLVEDDAAFARTLGGTVAASNREEGGAVVRVHLPLSAIAIQPEQAHDY